MFIFEEEGAAIGDLTGYTVILPAVSVGNAGQLCIDVLLENICKESTNTVQVLHGSVVPVVSPDPYDKCSSLISTQMYVVKDKKVVIFQIRSGILPGQGSVFMSDFLQWFQEKKCGELIVVGSIYSHERIDSQITGSGLRYLCTWDKSVPEDFIVLESRGSGMEANEDSAPHIPGGGISKRMFITCQKDNIPATFLFKFCSEGDNTMDGVILAQYLSKLDPKMAQLVPSSNPKIPNCWQSLFGHGAPVQMFW